MGKNEKCEALKKVHKALDEATMTMSPLHDKDFINQLSDMMRDIRIMIRATAV